MKSRLGNTTKSDPYTRDAEFADFKIVVEEDGSRSAIADGLSIKVLKDGEDMYVRHRRGVQPTRNRHFSTLICTLNGVNLYARPNADGSGFDVVMTTQKLQVS